MSTLHSNSKAIEKAVNSLLANENEMLKSWLLERGANPESQRLYKYVMGQDNIYCLVPMGAEHLPLEEMQAKYPCLRIEFPKFLIPIR